MLYDVIIIGGGPAGLAAGMYAARANLKTLLLEKTMPGGQAATTEMIENYPGFPEGINGFDLAMKFNEQARRFGMEVATAEVSRLELPGNVKKVITTAKEYTAKTVIIASGAQSTKLGVPGEAAFTGRGVSYCATCDGAFFRDKKVAVVGGGDAAVEEAIFLTKFASEVYLIHRRDTLRATKIVQDRAKNNPKITFIWNSVVEEIKGNEKVDELVVKNIVTGETTLLAVDGIFIYVGMKPNTLFLPPEIKVSPEGYIITNDQMETTIPGVFAAGDLRQKLLRQVVTAVADGAIAAVAAEKYIENYKEE